MSYETILSILAGLITAIPLVVKLVEYVQKSIKEKNWNNLLNLIMRLMEQAEKNYTTGAERKQWVMSMVEQSAGTINYDIDMDAVSQLIDDLCKLTKTVNAEVSKNGNSK